MQRLTWLLWNETSRRPRLPWRLLALVAVLFALGLVVGAVGGGRLATQVVVVLGSVSLVGRFVDRRRFRDFGFRVDRTWWLDLGFGLALGAALMAGIFVFELLAGWISVTGLFAVSRSGSAFWRWFGWSFLAFVAVGTYEEVLFRGYLITNVAEGLTWFEEAGAERTIALATLVTSLLFGLAHATNPNATLASVFGITVGALMLAAGYVMTGELAIPIGLHTAWNFFQGPVFGFPVSGTAGGGAVVATAQSGPPFLTGGRFGPEAGAVGVVAALVGLALTVAWVRWRGGEVRLAETIAAYDPR